jgi:hypothetical protein
MAKGVRHAMNADHRPAQATALAVVSDLLPQATRAGDLALYRLLGDWPVDRLLVVHSSRRVAKGTVLPGVPYRPIPVSPILERARHTRIGGFANLASITAARSVSEISRALGEFRPDAVLTVAQDFLWLAAARWCRRTGVPLHVIVHDDWPEFLHVPGWARAGLHRRFAAVLRQAKSRLCVSPGMKAEYESRYGIACDLLLPCRGDEGPRPAVRVPNAAQVRTVVGYLGGLPLAGYSKAIRAFADLLRGIDGSLSLYGSHTTASLTHEGLIHPAIAPQTQVPWDESFEHLTTHATALFCPVSFQPEDATIMRMLFPSKLADYTACGLPIIIWGPVESSAVRWARSHDHAAFVCTDPQGAGITDFLQRIRSDEDLAIRYAAGALAAGEKDFSLSAGRAKLAGALFGVDHERAD